MAKPKDLTGMKVGKLTVIDLNEEESNKPRKSGNRITKQRYWNCLCECGNTCIVKAEVLSRGGVKSCGCLRRETTKKRGQANALDLTGQKFGRLIVVQKTDERSRDGEIMWLCECECGNYKIVRTSSLKNNNIRSCGCLNTEVAKDKLAKVNEYQRAELHPNWQGKAEIKSWLFTQIATWKQQVLVINDYTCNVTKQRGGKLNVHHLKGFNTIVDEAHTINNIEIKQLLTDYTKKELDILLKYVKSQHTLEEGVVLCEEVHRLFHKIYGYGDNTLEQYEEFKQRYLNGEFNSDELDSATNVA